MGIVSIKLMGGLGNYLFQIATAQSIALRDNKTLVCDTNDILRIHQPYTKYLENIFKNIKFSDELKTLNNLDEVDFTYNEIPKIDGDVKLNGYFQSEKYFINYREDILNLFSIDDDTKTYLDKKYGDILGLNTCSIHVRRGDYLYKQNYHPAQDINYYYKSLNKIGYDKHFLIFSDDMEWCKQNFDFIPNKTFIEGNEDFQDLYLMSMCDNNIIANSSFSWWGAWMNINEDKKVIAPSKWFGNNNLHLDTNDLYCNKWIKI